MDVIYLHNLRVETVIGVWEWERRIRQTLLIDLDLGTDVSRAAETDDIADTVDYKAVSDRVIGLAVGSEFRLIEALASRIAATVIEEFGLKWIRVRINKQGVVRHVRDIGVVIERGERD
jgi:7,8-dihydroneopterin aldolase/epimerase/oxygenase